MIEFGKYKHTGFGIGGGSANKYGLYYNKAEHCYKNGADIIEDINTFWPQFRNEMCRFLMDSGEADQPLVLEEYPLLKGMAMVLTKFLSLYFPEKYVTIGSFSVLKDLMDKFHYAHEDGERCHQLNFRFNKNVRADIPELEKYNGVWLGRIAWLYMQGSPSNQVSVKGSGLGDEGIDEIHYWLYSPGDGAVIWNECYENGIMAIGWDEIGDLSQYTSKSAMKDAMKENIDPDRPYTMAAHATWQFVKEMKPGDIVFAKKGRSTVIGRGVVTSDYIFDDTRASFRNIRKVKWTHNGEWEHPGKAAMKTLTDITDYTEYVSKLNALFEDEGPEIESGEVEIKYPDYNADKFLKDVYMDEGSYRKLVALVKNKKNVILQGAPGVGKTYAAKRLAYSIIGKMHKDRVMMVQFHQSYSYEDFIEGFRPTSEGGFEIKKGAFYRFCKTAAEDSENPYFFIIDEINRGNLSKIFGELFVLIENDKRGNALNLLYSDEKFYVPQNVYIIGMMNTADRSLALLDYALRRRFAFYDMKPAFKQKGFVEYRNGLNSQKFNSLIECVERLNDVIREDSTLGEGFCIGHSYFCELKEVNDDVLNNIVEYELLPLLKEYWFDDPATLRDWTERLRSSIR